MLSLLTSWAIQRDQDSVNYRCSCFTQHTSNVPSAAEHLRAHQSLAEHILYMYCVGLGLKAHSDTNSKTANDLRRLVLRAEVIAELALGTCNISSLVCMLRKACEMRSKRDERAK